jgi:hypothetical protein
LLLAHATPVILEVCLRSLQQAEALFRLLLFFGKPLLYLSRNGSGIRLAYLFLLLGCFLLVSAFPLFLFVLLHDTFLSSSVTTATAGGVLLWRLARLVRS